MAATHHAGGSTKTLPSAVGHHDGHADGHLNCIALRHGWSRTFSISPQELSILDYETLETILEVNTLKLRPMGVRIFVENPADSGNWSKIRPWKHDGSLQSVLVQQFFEGRRDVGVITRVDVRDGTDRQDGDALSLRTVGSRILHRRDTTDDGKSTTSRRTWWGLSRNTSTRSRNARTVGTSTDVEDEDHPRDEDQPPPPPAKPSFFSLLRPHPQIPNQTSKRTSIFDFFRAKLLQPSTKPTKTRDQQRIDSNSTPEGQQLMEVEVLRKRGWIPPGLARRQRSLKERLRAEGLPADGTGGTRNPFFGSSRSGLNRSERKKKAAAAAATTDNTDTDVMVGDDPFADEAEVGGENMHGPDEITEQDVDDFFEIERPTSMIEMADHPAKDKSWSKFKPSKDRKNKNKARTAAAATSMAPIKGTLGGGAAVVQKPRDAFPDSPHHRETPEEAASID